MEEEGVESKKKAEEEKTKAAGVRTLAMERMGETKKRKETEDGKDNSKPKKSRRSGADTVEFLREKSEQDFMFKQQELESKKQQQEAESARHEAALKRQDGLMQLLIEQ